MEYSGGGEGGSSPPPRIWGAIAELVYQKFINLNMLFDLIKSFDLFSGFSAHVWNSSFRGMPKKIWNNKYYLNLYLYFTPFMFFFAYFSDILKEKYFVFSHGDSNTEPILPAYKTCALTIWAITTRAKNLLVGL